MAWRLVQFVMIVLTSFTPTSLHSASLLTQIQIGMTVKTFSYQLYLF